MGRLARRDLSRRANRVNAVYAVLIMLHKAAL